MGRDCISTRALRLSFIRHEVHLPCPPHLKASFDNRIRIASYSTIDRLVQAVDLFEQ